MVVRRSQGWTFQSASKSSKHGGSKQGGAISGAHTVDQVSSILTVHEIQNLLATPSPEPIRSHRRIGSPDYRDVHIATANRSAGERARDVESISECKKREHRNGGRSHSFERVPGQGTEEYHREGRRSLIAITERGLFQSLGTVMLYILLTAPRYRFGPQI